MSPFLKELEASIKNVIGLSGDRTGRSLFLVHLYHVEMYKRARMQDEFEIYMDRPFEFVAEEKVEGVRSKHEAKDDSSVTASM